MKRVLFLTNIPAPYRVEFFNQLGQHVDLHVVFEARYAKNIQFRFDETKKYNFNYYFLFDQDIKEKRIKFKVIKYLNKSWDEIFITNYAYFTEMFALIYLKIKRVPYVLELDGHTESKENFLKFYFKRFLIKGAKNYFSSSQSTDQYLMKYGVSLEKIIRYPFTSVLEQDVIPKPLTSNEKSKLKIELKLEDKFTVLMVARLIPIKGIDIFFKVAKELKDFQFVFVGGQPDQIMIDNYGLNDINNLKFVDNIPKHELIKYYQASDVFFFPTQKESWGLVINEAMSQGLPIVSTTECKSAVELLGLNNPEFIFQPKDWIGMRNKIKELILNNNKREKLVKNTLSTIKNSTIENMVLYHLDSLYIN